MNRRCAASVAAGASPPGSGKCSVTRRAPAARAAMSAGASTDTPSGSSATNTTLAPDSAPSAVASPQRTEARPAAGERGGSRSKRREENSVCTQPSVRARSCAGWRRRTFGAPGCERALRHGRDVRLDLDAHSVAAVQSGGGHLGVSRFIDGRKGRHQSARARGTSNGGVLQRQEASTRAQRASAHAASMLTRCTGCECTRDAPPCGRRRSPRPAACRTEPPAPAWHAQAHTRACVSVAAALSGAAMRAEVSHVSRCVQVRRATHSSARRMLLSGVTTNGASESPSSHMPWQRSAGSRREHADTCATENRDAVTSQATHNVSPNQLAPGTRLQRVRLAAARVRGVGRRVAEVGAQPRRERRVQRWRRARHRCACLASSARHAG
jgi:hypothetical protein